MPAEGSAKATEKSTQHPAARRSQDSNLAILGWLRTWRQVLIAELLITLERRSYGYGNLRG